ncbi:MAG: hypothetical protein ACI4XL_01420 [Bacillus sp. (in: firmicutes)]
MEELLQSVQTSLSNRSHLDYLLKKVQAVIVLESESGRWIFCLSGMEHRKLRNEIWIRGSHECLQQIIRGEAALRKMQKLRLVAIRGNYRQVLLLESILLLGMASTPV